MMSGLQANQKQLKIWQSSGNEEVALMADNGKSICERYGFKMCSKVSHDYGQRLDQFANKYEERLK